MFADQEDRKHCSSAASPPKRAPSQSILRLGLSKHRRVKRLHPYFEKNKLKNYRQVVPDAERNLEKLDNIF